MDQNILISLIGVGSALTGTIAGGVISHYANKSMKQIEWQHSIRSKKIESKTNLYSGFLREATDLQLDSRDSKINGLSDIKILTGMLMQIELTSSTSVHEKAAQLANTVVYSHIIEEQKSPEDKVMPYSEARKEFVQAVKIELTELENT